MSAFDLEFIGIVSFQFVLFLFVLWFAMRYWEDENQENLLQIAYVHDPNTNTFVVIQCVGKRDYAIAEFQHENMVTQWIDHNFIRIGETEDYSLCKPRQDD